MKILQYFQFNNFNKRKALSIFLILVLLGTGGFFALRNIFKADTLSAISGNIYDSVQKSPLADVSISVSPTNSSSTLNSISTKTDATGHYSISAPYASFTHILITKDGFWDMEGSIVNVGGFSSITANLTMKPGFGKEDIQLTAFKGLQTGHSAQFGLSINPVDDKSAAKEIVPSGNSYKEQSVGSGYGYDLNLNQETYPDPNVFQFTAGGKLPEELTDPAAAYLPDNDKYYIFGGKRTDGSLSDAIYEYDRNSPNDATKVATLPYGNANGSAIYIPQLKRIYYFATSRPGIGGSEFFSFGLEDNPKALARGINYNLIPVGSIQDSIKISTFLVKDKIFVAFVQGDKPNQTFIESSTINNIGDGAEFQTTGVWMVDFSGVTPYYSSYQNKIYLFGGNSGSIYEINPNDTLDPVNPKPATLNNNKLGSSVDSPKIHKIGEKAYLFNGSSVTDKMIVIDDTKTKISFTGTKDITIPANIQSYPSVEDNSNRTIIFSPTTQTLAPVFTYRAGQAYTISPTRDVTIVFRGRAKKDAFSFKNKDIDENYPWRYGPTRFANPYATDIASGDLTFNYQNKDYTLKEAIDQNIISQYVFNANYPDQIRLSPDTLDQIIKPGDFIAFWTKKSGVKVIIGQLINGTVKAGDKPIGRAHLVFSSSKNSDDFQETATSDNGSYDFQAPSLSYNTISIQKEGYKDTTIHIINSSHRSSFNPNIELEPGLGTLDIEMVPIKKDQTANFGLDMNPDDKFSYQLANEGMGATIQSFELNQGKYVPVETNKFEVTEAGQLDDELAGATASYSSTNNKIYLFGGINASTNQPSTAISAYDPTNQNPEYVNDLPEPLYGAASLEILSKNLILIIGGKKADGTYSDKIYGYYVDDNKLISLGNIPSAEQYSVASDNFDYYIFAQSANNSQIYHFTLNDLVNKLTSANCQPSQAQGCETRLLSNPFFTNATLPVGFIPYVQSSVNKIYLIGGDENSNPTNQIYSLNTDGSNFHQETVNLPFALSNAPHFTSKDQKKLYIFGGTTSNNQPSDQGVLIQTDKNGGLTASTLANFKLNNPVKTVPFASDTFGNYYIFSSTGLSLDSAVGATERFIQKISPVASFKAGQVYSITPSNDNILSFKKSVDYEGDLSNQEDYAISSFDMVQPNNNYYFTASSSEPESIVKYKITNNDLEYNLIEAAKSNLIDPTIKINDRSINLNSLTKKDLKSILVYPGDKFTITDKADSTFSKDGDIINYDYDNGYKFIKSATENLKKTGFSDDEINYIMNQIDYCNPSFYDTNTSDAERNACIGSIRLQSGSSTASNAKSVLTALIPKASATGFTDQDAQNFLKTLKINPRAIPNSVKRRAEFYASPTDLLGLGDPIGPKKRYTLYVMAWYKQKLSNDWTGYFTKIYESIVPNQYDRSPTNCYNTMMGAWQDKNFWRSTSTLNSLYDTWWYKDPHRGDDKFTVSEKRELNRKYYGGLNKVCDTYPIWHPVQNQLRGRQRYVTEATPLDVLGVMTIILDPAMFTIKAIATRGLEETSAEKLLLNLGKSYELAANFADISKPLTVEKSMAAAYNTKLEASLVKVYKTPGLELPGKTTLGEMKIDLTLHGRDSALISAVEMGKGYDAAIEATDAVTKSRFMDFFSEANGGRKTANFNLYHAVYKSKVNDKIIGDVIAQARKFSDRKSFIEWGLNYFKKDKYEKILAAIHESIHILEPADIKHYEYWKTYRINSGSLISEEIDGIIQVTQPTINPFIEGRTEFLARAIARDNAFYIVRFGAYQNEVEIYNAMSKTIQELFHVDMNKSEEIIAEMTAKYGYKEFIDGTFNEYARNTMFKGRPMIGPSDSFHDYLYELMLVGKWDDAYESIAALAVH